MEANIMLLAAAKKMDQDALIEVFDLYAPGLYKYAVYLCNDAVTADQIVGDVFAKLLEQLHAGTGPTVNLRAYLYKMAYHLVVDESRHSRHWTPLEDDHAKNTTENSISVTAEERVLLEGVMRAITYNLTDDQRHVVILRFLEGFSLKETATIIGKSVDNVKVIQNRAINSLRKALDRQAIETSSISFAIQSMART